jgi:hypothetical protein
MSRFLGVVSGTFFYVLFYNFYKFIHFYQQIHPLVAVLAACPYQIPKQQIYLSISTLLSFDLECVALYHTQDIALLMVSAI